MSADIRIVKSTEAPAWDAYVQSHGHATLYHLYAWQGVIQDTYNHKPYYLIAVRKSPKLNLAIGTISGILPLVHLKSYIFGNQLVSIPFFDIGGVLADDDDTEQALIAQAIRLGKSLAVDSLELRHLHPASFVGSCSTNSHKVRMLLDLPESAEALMKGFKSKLRSQIKKALKEGLKAEIGELELLDDFYEVFLVNMRDLGSPVHSKMLMENVLRHFPNDAKIVIVRNNEQAAVAGSLVVGFKNVLENPWASSLRRFSHLNANMLLYWAMLEYACEKDLRQFDFGRSTPDEGAYKFKAQWGAKPEPLDWVNIILKGPKSGGSIAEDKKFQLASQIWRRLPVPVTRVLGPRIRKYIAL